MDKHTISNICSINIEKLNIKVVDTSRKITIKRILGSEKKEEN